MTDKKGGIPIPLIVLAIVVLGGGGLGIERYLAGRGHVTTDDAYVTGDIVRVSPQIAGTVVAFNADETQFVRQGQVLVQLDPEDSKIAVQQAEANLGQVVRDVAQMFAAERRDVAAVAASQVQLSRVEQDLARDQTLINIHGVSAETLQHDQQAVHSARAALDQAEAVLRTTRAAIEGTTPETHPRVLQAEAALRNAWLTGTRTKVAAPVSGYVVRRAVQLGQQVTPASEMFGIVPADKVWIDANFKENQLAELRIGQPVAVTTDIYGSAVTFHGHVQGLVPGSGSALAVLPAQNASGNWIKIVQRLPVRIGLDAKELEAHPLFLGLSSDVNVDVHDHGGVALSKLPAWNAAATTDIYAPQDDGVNADIARIVAANLAKETAADVGQR
jgi:membrane fusion protein (multidrug efflux system)